MTALPLLFTFGPNHRHVSDHTPPGSASGFNAPVYALDTVLPIVDFGERDQWTVNVDEPWSWLYGTSIWLAIAAGWILSTMLLAAAARLI